MAKKEFTSADVVPHAITAATAIVTIGKLNEQRDEQMKLLNADIATLHKAKITIGTRKTCPVAVAFYDTLVAGGLKPTTAANYLSTFRQAVASGKPLKEWNPAQSKNKGAKKSNTAPEGDEALSVKIANAYNMRVEFKNLCDAIQGRFENDEHDSIYEGFRDFLLLHGYALTDDDASAE